jgi:hypothetical protein
MATLRDRYIAALTALCGDGQRIPRSDFVAFTSPNVTTEITSGTRRWRIRGTGGVWFVGSKTSVRYTVQVRKADSHAVTDRTRAVLADIGAAVLAGTAEVKQRPYLPDSADALSDVTILYPQQQWLWG